VETVEIQVTIQDCLDFFKAHPEAGVEVENISLRRMLRERDAELARLRDGAKPMQPLAPGPVHANGVLPLG